MRALIVDDEVHARRALESLLAATGEFEVLGTCANAFEALQAIRADSPDVLFLDVQMPKVDGFELLAMIDADRLPKVVFVTAYDEHALQAFEKDAVDYLLKPVSRERLATAIEKLKRATIRMPPCVARAIERIPCSGARGSIRLVDASEVEFVRCNVAGVYVATPRGEFFTELTLTVLEAKTDLVRCHRQFLVNMSHIEEILRPAPRAAVLRTRSGKEIPASRRYFTKLKERLGLGGGEGKYGDRLG